MSNLLLAIKFLSKVTTCMFASNSIFVSLVDLPASKQCGTNIAITYFEKMFKKAGPMQGALTLLSFTSSFAAYYLERDNRFVYLGLLVLSCMPITLFLLMPINKALLDNNLDRSSGKAKILIKKWSNIHAIRSCIGVAALVLANLI